MQTPRSVQTNAVAAHRHKISPLLFTQLLLVCFLITFLALAAQPVSAAFLTFVEQHKDGVNPVDGLNFVQSVTVSPDGKHVYAASWLDNAVAVFSRNATTGALTFVEMQKDGVGGVDGLAFAYSVTVSPDGAHVYAAGETDDAIAVFSRNTTTGALTFVEMQKDGVGGVDGLDGARSVTVSPDGSHVYATGAIDDAVAVFSRNAITGALTFVEMQKDGVGGVDGLDGARSVTVSPDGKHVYTAGENDNAVAVFSRNATTGALTFVQVQKDAIDLGFAKSVTVSPDNQHVYATGISSVVVFSRNATTGALTFVEFKRDGVGGVDGLSGALWVTVSPDGQHIYTLGANEDTLVVFSRNATTGALTFVEMQKDGVDGVDGLDFIQSVAVSPDNLHVYTGSGIDNAVAVFRAGSAPLPTDTPTATATATATSTATATATPTQTVTPISPVIHLPLIMK